MSRSVPLLAAAAASLVLVGAAEARPAAPSPQIVSIALDGSDPRTLGSGGMPTQAADGRIAFLWTNGLWVMAPDGTGHRVVAPAALMEDVVIQPAWSARGEIAFGRWDGSSCGAYGLTNCSTAVLMVADSATGSVREVARSRYRGAGSFSWAPRGGRIAYLGELDRYRTNRTLEVIRADGTGRRVLLRASGEGEGLHEPAWSPRGDWIVFRRIVYRRSDLLWLVRPEGGPAKRLVQGRSPTWSPTGDRLLYVSGHALRTINVSTGRVRQLAHTRGISHIAWSPDGRRVAFVTPARIEVVHAADGAVISTAPPPDGFITSFFFTRDGQRLVYG